MTAKTIEEHTGLKVRSISPVTGGNTSNAYRVDTTSRPFFFKEMGFDACPGLFQKEENGLTELSGGSSLVIPEVLKNSFYGSKQFILLTWLEKKEPTQATWSDFGERLAKMHSCKQPYFGFFENNYLGSLIQQNSPQNTWSGFYSQCRLLPFATELADSDLLAHKDILALENLCGHLGSIFPAESPALLHGDLWSGNCMFTHNGPAIFDPATYYGHREMDIGMTLLFGGFDKKFYESYDYTYPLAKGWRERLPYTQLYPLLAHAVFFKGHYLSPIKEILKPFYTKA